MENPENSLSRRNILLQNEKAKYFKKHVLIRFVIWIHCISFLIRINYLNCIVKTNVINMLEIFGEMNHPSFRVEINMGINVYPKVD